MRTIFLIIFTFVSITIGTQDINRSKRLEYLKEHHLFVVKDEIDTKKPSVKQNRKGISKEKTITDNIKKCLETFWDLNDSIKYISSKEIKLYKKLFPDDLFLEFHLENFYAYHLQIPSNAVSLNDVSPRLIDFSDTSLLAVTQELRLLRYNVIYGDTKYQGGNTVKILLIMDEPAANDYHQKFIDRYKNKYPNNIQIENRDFITKTVYLKDPRFVYIHKLCIINCEDGSMVPL